MANKKTHERIIWDTIRSNTDIAGDIGEAALWALCHRQGLSWEEFDAALTSLKRRGIVIYTGSTLQALR